MARTAEQNKSKQVKVANKTAAKAAAPGYAQQAPSSSSWSMRASTMKAIERGMTQAVTSVVQRPSGGGTAATANFQRMYSSLVHEVPNEFRLKLIEKMREGLGIVEQELRAEQLGSTAGKNNGRVSTADFVARLRRQEQDRREQQIASKDLLSSAEMSERLEITTAALTAAVKAKRMFALKGPGGRNAFPSFFADRSLDRHVLERVSRELGDLPAVSKYFFFTSPRTSLSGKSPLQALAKGKVNDVVAAAKAFAEE